MSTVLMCMPMSQERYMDTAKKTAFTRPITISPTASAYPTHSRPASRVVTNPISSLGRQLQGVNHLIANA